MPESLLKTPQEIQVVPQIFRTYEAFINRFKIGLNGVARPFIDETIFKDGSPWLHIILDTGKESDLANRTVPFAYVPFWLSPQFDTLGENLFKVEQEINALTHEDRGKGRLPITSRIIGVVPYIEMRQDKDSTDPTNGENFIGEAINVEIMANDLAINGMRELIMFEPHSNEAYSYFVKAGIACLPLTAAPLFASHLHEKGKVTDDTDLLALDKGSLQKNWHLANLLGLDPFSRLVVLNKPRTGHNEIGPSTLLYGNPSGKNIVIFDDVLDTSSSIGSTSESLRKAGARKITVMFTHGVLSFPGRNNIINLLKHGVIDEIVTTDSLPRAAFSFEEVAGVTVIPVAELMASTAKLVAETSIQETLNNQVLAPYILVPQDKELVWQSFKEQTPRPLNL